MPRFIYRKTLIVDTDNNKRFFNMSDFIDYINSLMEQAAMNKWQVERFNETKKPFMFEEGKIIINETL